MTQIDKSKRKNYLDLVRAIAILIIITYHFNCSIVDNNIKTIFCLIYENEFLSWGVVGVKLFLIVSGAVLMYQYNDKLQLRMFYKKRIQSIFPLFFIVYIIAFVCRYLILRIPLPNIPVYRIIFTFLGLDGYLSSYVPMFNLVGDWFIGVILLYYVVFPILRKLLMTNSIYLMMIGLITFLFSVYVEPFGINPSVSILGNILPFVFGMIFLYQNNIKDKNIIIALIIMIIFSIIKLDKIIISTTIGLLLFLTIYLLSLKLSYVKIVYLISKYSYCGFLVHHIIISFIVGSLSGKYLSPISKLFVFCVCLFIIAIASVLILEIYKIILNTLERRN